MCPTFCFGVPSLLLLLFSLSFKSSWRFLSPPWVRRAQFLQEHLFHFLSSDFMGGSSRGPLMPGMWAVWVLMDKSAVVSLTPLLKMLGGHRCLLCLLLIPYWSTVSVFFFFHLHQETLKKSLSCPFQEGQTNSWSHAVSSNTFTQLSCYINSCLFFLKSYLHKCFGICGTNATISSKSPVPQLELILVFPYV